MKKLVKMITMVLLGTMLFTTTAFAAEVNPNVNETKSINTQTISDYIVETKQCSSSAGTVVAVVSCTYTGQWDEGYAGWINNASFEISYARIGSTQYTAIPVGQSWYSGSSAYQIYKINNVNVLLSVTMDEWGSASLGMVQN